MSNTRFFNPRRSGAQRRGRRLSRRGSKQRNAFAIHLED
jgi:hypothetical protein